MVWTNLSTNYTNSAVGVLDFANSSTSSFFAGSIICIIWLVVVIATHNRSPKYSFVVAGFFAMLFASLMKVMMASFSDVILLASFGSFIMALFIMIFVGDRE